MLDGDQALKLLILNSDLPVFPGRAGHEHLHTTRLARLASKVGLVSLVHTYEQHEKKQGLAEAGVKLYLWESPALAESAAVSANGKRPPWVRRVAKTVYNLARSGLRRPLDTLIQDLQFRNLSGPLLQALNTQDWQTLVVVQSTCARWLDYVPPLPSSVLVMHDVRALVYERQAQTATSLYERLTRELEAWFYRRFERTYCHKYDLIVTVSAADETWIRQHYGLEHVVTIPIPVDGDYFAPMPGVREVPARILFSGMMNHPPNMDAACFFAYEVLPQIQAAIPEAEFWIVGRDPAASVRALMALPGVVVTGNVLNIRPYLAQAAVMVVPLRFGSGMRNKILEAWAMQKCIVSTQIGAEGLDSRNGENILIADDARTMADSVIRALQDPDLRNRIREQGRKLILEQHHPDKLAKFYYQAVTSRVYQKRQQDDPMRVAIDLRWMRPGVTGGIEQLSRSFLDRLVQLDHFNRYTVLAPSEIRFDFDLRHRSNFRIAADGLGYYAQRLLGRGVRFVHRRLKRDYWRSPEVETLQRIRAFRADIALSIPGYIHTDLYPLSNVLVVPDIQHEYYPEFFSPQQLDERRRIYTDSIRRADHLCAISEFTRQTLIERLEVAPGRVTTTHLAADARYATFDRATGDYRQVLSQYHLPVGGYLLLPANTWPHKNHRTALQALRILQDDYGLDPLLVCTGSAKEAHAEVMQLVHDLRLENRVKFLGYCSSEDLPALYAGAEALVFPSLFEGFGMPVLEAMWCECPVVCSNTTSLPEIAGEGAVLVDPHSPEAWAQAVSRVLTDRDLRCGLAVRGREQARKFSWEKFTLDVVRIFRQVHHARYGG